VELQKATPKPFRFSDPRQERIYRRLLLVGPGPASFYRDACRLMEAEPPFNATTHMIAHLLREIESALRDVLESVVDRSQRISGKDVSSDGKHEAEIRTVLKSLGIPETDPMAQGWLRLPGKGNYYGLAARAHRDALAQPRSLDQEFREFWGEIEAIFDNILEKFESRYLASFRLLDQLLADPSPAQVDAKRLRHHVPNNLVAFSYFFGKLSCPAWLELLRAEGFFKHPPEPDRDKGTVSFPSWPESRYLARMAALAPETVIEIALQIPDTENLRVHQDLADAACEMPPELAARWARKETRWVPSQRYLYFLLPEKLGGLVSHLAKGGQVNEALDLARALLTVLPDPQAAKKASEDEIYHPPPEPRARFDTWGYEQILNKHIPDLVPSAGLDALMLLCELLEDAVRFSRRRKGDEGPEDYSYMWRPTIEDHSQNRRRGLQGLLVSAVRDAAQALMVTESKPVLEIVEGRPFKIFQCIGLHLRRKWPEVDPEGTASLVADPTMFDDVHLHHELFHLLREQFNSLPPKAQQAYLDLIAQGIDAKSWLNLRERESGHRPSPEEGERYMRHWQYTKLWPIQEFLDQEWRQRFDALKQQFGELDHPDFQFYVSAVWAGPTSPKKAEDLRPMSIEELVSFLNTWQPSEDPMSPSPEGLGRELTALVTSEPDRFAAEARRFQGLEPTYIRALLLGLREVVKQKASFPWRPVLDLCRWVMDQSREIPGRKGEYDDLGPHWGWTRKAIADLLAVGFQSGASEIPFDLPIMAWEVLKPLTDDPEPTPEYEARYGGSNMDPATLLINTTRGAAMHALIRYALWVRRHIGEAAGGKERVARGFDEMPEVRRVLDHHLDPSHDPALAIRAVYGQWFPWLVLLDSRWTAQRVAEIFPPGETLRDLRDTAWETYITFCAPYDNVFDLLHEEYCYAVERIGTASSESRRLADPDERLAEHLMTLYWRGKLSFDEPDGLLARFYAKASDSLRSHALAFVGRSLHSTEEEIALQVVDRLQVLWQRRLDAARSGTPSTSHTAELAAFGWWFASAKFDDVWAIAQLKEALKLAGRVEREHLVVEHLATLAAEMPAHAVECLNLILEGDKEGWHIHGWRERARTILVAALQSTDDIVQQTAVDLVHRLCARGHLAFRDLLSERGS